MSTYNSDRRSVLKIIGAIGATCAYPFAGDELFGQTQEAHGHHALPPVDTTRRFFRDQDFAMISRISELIIPETDTPGAIGAGVPDYIDLLVSRATDHQFLVADGLRWLNEESERVANQPFLDLSEVEQYSILQPLCDWNQAGEPLPRNVEFFRLIKSLTADGYYTSRVGLVDELGYKGNTVRASYPDCVHEH
jgi:gluconate 2-dehydrogenase gamma chain